MPGRLVAGRKVRPGRPGLAGAIHVPCPPHQRASGLRPRLRLLPVPQLGDGATGGKLTSSHRCAGICGLAHAASAVTCDCGPRPAPACSPETFGACPPASECPEIERPSMPAALETADDDRLSARATVRHILPVLVEPCIDVPAHGPQTCAFVRCDPGRFLPCPISSAHHA